MLLHTQPVAVVATVPHHGYSALYRMFELSVVHFIH